MPPYNGPRGTGFTSLKQYLELNPESAQRMGDELVGGVNAKGTAAQQGINAAKDTFDAKAAAGTAKYEDGATTSADALARAEGATYKGPTSLREVADVDALGKQATEAINRSRALTSDADRAVLLGERYGSNGSYTPGAVGLDAFLAGRGAGGRAQEASSRWAGLRGALGLAETGAVARADTARADSATAAEQYRARAGVLAGQEKAATDAARQVAVRERAERMAPILANQERANNTWSGSDNQVSPGGKNNRVEEDLYDEPSEKLRRYP